MDEIEVQDIENLSYFDLDYFVSLINLKNFVNLDL